MSSYFKKMSTLKHMTSPFCSTFVIGSVPSFACKEARFVLYGNANSLTEREEKAGERVRGGMKKRGIRSVVVKECSAEH